ncbi:MAG: LPS-assembly lipoprotein [Bacteroidia bacterium]|jgi:LPS-assembly lipoprotein
MKPQLLRYSVLLLICSTLLGCGFQLRGTGLAGTLLPDDWKSMYLVTTNPNSELSREITARFAANGITWQAREAANYSLIVGSERFKQQNLSLSSDARAAEFELTLKAEFSVLDVQQQIVIEKSEAIIIKQMENDPRNVVGKAEEVRLLRDEMRGELAEQLLRRIGFFATSKQSETSNEARAE